MGEGQGAGVLPTCTPLLSASRRVAVLLPPAGARLCALRRGWCLGARRAHTRACFVHQPAVLCCCQCQQAAVLWRARLCVVVLEGRARKRVRDYLYTSI